MNSASEPFNDDSEDDTTDVSDDETDKLVFYIKNCASPSFSVSVRRKLMA